MLYKPAPTCIKIETKHVNLESMPSVRYKCLFTDDQKMSLQGIIKLKCAEAPVKSNVGVNGSLVSRSSRMNTVSLTRKTWGNQENTIGSKTVHSFWLAV